MQTSHAQILSALIKRVFGIGYAVQSVEVNTLKPLIRDFIKQHEQELQPKYVPLLRAHLGLDEGIPQTQAAYARSINTATQTVNHWYIGACEILARHSFEESLLAHYVEDRYPEAFNECTNRTHPHLMAPTVSFGTIDDLKLDAPSCRTLKSCGVVNVLDIVGKTDEELRQAGGHATPIATIRSAAYEYLLRFRQK